MENSSTNLTKSIADTTRARVPMEAKLHTIDSTLRRVCRRLDALEEEVQLLPLKFTKCFQDDTSDLRHSMEVLASALKSTASVAHQPPQPQQDAQPVAAVACSASATSKKKAKASETARHPSPARLTSPSSSSSSTEDEVPGWVIPPVSCRVLWSRWFHGDSRVDAYWKLGDSLSDRQSKQRFETAQFVMRALVQTAVDLDMVVSEEALRTTRDSDHPAIFDKAFRQFVQEADDGSLGRPGFEKLSFKQALHLNFLVVASKLRQQRQQRPVPSAAAVSSTQPTKVAPPNAAGSSKSTRPKSNSELISNFIQLASTMPTSSKKPSTPKASAAAPSAPPSPETSFLAVPAPTASTDSPWQYPLKTCQEMWHLWFRGDPSASPSLGPLRLVMAVSFPDKLSKSRCKTARSIMTRIEAAAVEFVSLGELNAMDTKDLDAAFTKAFTRAVGLDPAYQGQVQITGLSHLSFASVSDMSYSALSRQAALSRRRLGIPLTTNAPDATAPGYETTFNGDDLTDDDDQARPVWQFPTLTLREMWRCYFHGPFDGVNVPPTVGPFRHVARAEPRRAFVESKRIARLVAACAVDHRLVEREDDIEKMSENDSLDLLERAIALFLGAQNGSLTRAGFEDRSLAQVMDLKCSTVVRRLQKAAGQNASPAPPQERESPPPTPRPATPAPPAVVGAPPAQPMDGATNATVPSGWEFPRTSCRDLWRHWFVGDASIGPYRTLSPTDFSPDDQVSPKRLAAAQNVTATLIGVADKYMFVERGVAALPTMNEEDVMVVFDRAFDVLMYNNPEGNVAGYGPSQIQPEYAETCLFTTVSRILTRGIKRKRDTIDDM